jgi:hypothetical protein
MGVRGLARHLVTHPRDLPVVVSAGWVMRESGWWRRLPPLPTPGAAYWHFRLTTAYGTKGEPTVHDIVTAARWSRDVRRNASRS